MTVFSVHHTTTYRYRKPVRPGQHQLMFRPRDSFDQRLLDYRLKVTPEPAEIRWLHDVFGNCVTLVDFAASSEVLKFESVIRLDHTPENAARRPPHPFAGPRGARRRSPAAPATCTGLRVVAGASAPFTPQAAVARAPPGGAEGIGNVEKRHADRRAGGLVKPVRTVGAAVRTA